MELDPQQSAVLDALEYDLTVADSDTASVAVENVEEAFERDGASECEEQEEAVPFALVEDPINGEVQARNISVGLQMDEVDLRDVFMMTPIIMKSAPPFMRSCFKSAMRLACKTIVQGRRVNDVELEMRGWKLFVLVPRMFLFRPPRGGWVSREWLIERVIK